MEIRGKYVFNHYVSKDLYFFEIWSDWLRVRVRVRSDWLSVRVSSIRLMHSSVCQPFSRISGKQPSIVSRLGQASKYRLLSLMSRDADGKPHSHTPNKLQTTHDETHVYSAYCIATEYLWGVVLWPQSLYFSKIQDSARDTGCAGCRRVIRTVLCQEHTSTHYPYSN